MGRQRGLTHIQLWAEKVVLPSTADGCWAWRGSITGRGYASARQNSKTVVVHRYVYERFIGPIPPGLVIDHLCRNRSCVNPSHMEPVTNKENLLRGDTFGARNIKKTHCPGGHPYSGDNLIVSGGARFCRACAQASMRKRTEARRSAKRQFQVSPLSPPARTP